MNTRGKSELLKKDDKEILCIIKAKMLGKFINLRKFGI